MTIRKTRFVADWLPEGESFEGWSIGQRWNGWACPAFERSEAERLALLLNTLGAEEGFNTVYAWWGDTLVGFDRTYEAEGLASCVDLYAPILPDAHVEVPTWSIGAGDWTWEEEDDWKEDDERAAARHMWEGIESAPTVIVDDDPRLRLRDWDVQNLCHGARQAGEILETYVLTAPDGTRFLCETHGATSRHANDPGSLGMTWIMRLAPGAVKDSVLMRAPTRIS